VKGFGTWGSGEGKRKAGKKCNKDLRSSATKKTATDKEVSENKK